MADVTLELTEGEFKLVSVLVGDFYRAMLHAGVPEWARGRQEVAELIEKLTDLAGVIKVDYDDLE